MFSWKWSHTPDDQGRIANETFWRDFHLLYFSMRHSTDASYNLVPSASDIMAAMMTMQWSPRKKINGQRQHERWKERRKSTQRAWKCTFFAASKPHRDQLALSSVDPYFPLSYTHFPFYSHFSGKYDAEEDIVGYHHPRKEDWVIIVFVLQRNAYMYTAQFHGLSVLTPNEHKFLLYYFSPSCFTHDS